MLLLERSIVMQWKEPLDWLFQDNGGLEVSAYLIVALDNLASLYIKENNVATPGNLGD